ncbi:MAG: phage tail tip lysozyme [Oscillospiraceae bacterium]|nr:phage tail tip lysozyme [Oscillospiraceae bacterium]
MLLVLLGLAVAVLVLATQTGCTPQDSTPNEPETGDNDQVKTEAEITEQLVEASLEVALEEFNTTSTVHSSNNPLSLSQMLDNSNVIREYLTDAGWSVNAISALLANMVSESTINPGRWQDGVGPGYGLVQWDPATKYTNWANAEGYSEDGMVGQLERILLEVSVDGSGSPWDDNLNQWQGFRVSPSVSFQEFTTCDDKSAYDLAIDFMLCYERPADKSEQAKDHRGKNAEQFYNYFINGTTPELKDKNGNLYK